MQRAVYVPKDPNTSAEAIPSPCITKRTASHSAYNRSSAPARPQSPPHHPLPHLTQSRTSRNLAPVLPTCILGTTPQYFSSSTCSRPDHVVQVHAINLLAPDVDFAA